MPTSTGSYAAPSAGADLKPHKIERRDVGPDDVHIAVRYCGVCHSDIHQAKNEWGNSSFPMVPGHEIVGIVETVGKDVKKFKKGDRAGVGCFVDACMKCEYCNNNDEQYCAGGAVPTYNGTDKAGKPTYGGYSRDIVVKEHFVCKVPDSLDLAAAAPLLCAGITTYSPMKHWGMDQKGKRIGVIGLGGLGHMAVQFGKAFGNDVVIISRSPKKRDIALKEFGVPSDMFVVSTDEVQTKKAMNTLDFIIDTVSAPKDMNLYLSFLKTNGVLVSVGLPPKGFEATVNPAPIIIQRKTMAGSLVGGLKRTQEVLDFCAEHKIACKIEMIKMDQINEAYERVIKSDVKYRFVIDIDGSCPKAESI